MIIGISGYAGAGKDTIGKIIQDYSLQGFEIKKFADKLKKIVCILLNCTMQDLENRQFKETELNETWWYWREEYYEGNELITKLTSYSSTAQMPSWPDCELIKLTPRKLLQLLGTECGRQIIHPDIWVNALMGEYTEGSNWVITDCRFPNEYQAIKSKGGVIIRVHRDDEITYSWSTEEVVDKLKSLGYAMEDLSNWEDCARAEGFNYSPVVEAWSYNKDFIKRHESETALDNSEFDYRILNNADIGYLKQKVTTILKDLNIK